MQTHNRRQTPAGTSLACGPVSESFKDKPVLQLRSEKNPQGCRISAKHSVFVLGQDGSPLTPTTPTKAKKLLRANVAKKCWSKLGIFGIQLLTATDNKIPESPIGCDWGTKFDGYAVVVGTENNLNVMLLLPNKKTLVKKIEERRILRRARRHRNCRRRAARFNNRTRKPDWIAPSQAAVVNSRLKIIREICRIFPIRFAAIEDVRFNHRKYRWGANFSTVEIGKTRLKKFFDDRSITRFEYSGIELKELQRKYGYHKTADKSAEKVTSHCTDALTYAVDVTVGDHVDIGRFIVVDDTYRPHRRKLHYTQPAKGGIRAKYSKGTVFGLRKGLLIGTKRTGQLCGELKGGYRYLDADGNRQSSKTIEWVSSNFRTREPKSTSAPPRPEVRGTRRGDF